MTVLLDLRDAHLVASPDLSPVEAKAMGMLVHEVERRTGIVLPVSQARGSGPAIVVLRASGTGLSEGYRVTTTGKGVEIQGNDERGTLFGVGRLLREFRWGRWQVGVPTGLDIQSSPAYPLRGHQIGYRPKVNTYDGWTPAIFEQYVRDLVVFGCNAIEIMPPRTDDDDDSPHFPLPKLTMMVEMSRIIASYGLDVWVWYPALDGDYAKPEIVAKSLAEWENVLSRLPRVDHLHIPGGDPGHSEPRVLMPFLEKAATLLRKYHASAKFWIAPQCFTAEWHEQFLGIIEGDVPWLDGVVYGPWTRISLPELRRQVPSRYPVRYYPDTTHTTHSEFTVPDWDVALAVTEGREVINPQPRTAAKIFKANSPSTIGFVTYSEGVHDDVNKCIWSSLGWDPEVDMISVLREYSRYYIGGACEEGLAASLFNLEDNWTGALITNVAVDNTLRQAQAIERCATPQMRLNWRFQQILYRAYFDAFVRERLISETALEQLANEKLRLAPRTGSVIALDEAERVLDEAVTKPVAQDLRSRVFELGEALYQSIRMQLSVDRYAAVAVSRGAQLDSIDVPLNNRWWLKNRFVSIRDIENEKQRLDAIEEVLGRTDPGPNGFYDDLGNPRMQPHLVSDGPGFDLDPGAYHSVRRGFACFSGGFVGRVSRDAIDPDGAASFLKTPNAWWTWAETRYETPLTLRYDRLDPNARYILRVVIAVERVGRKFRLVADDGIEIHSWIKCPKPIQPIEFEIPSAALATGTLTLHWHVEPGGGSFDSSFAISEAFLMRRES